MAMIRLAEACENIRAAHAYGLLTAQQTDLRLRVCVYDGRSLIPDAPYCGCAIGVTWAPLVSARTIDGFFQNDRAIKILVTQGVVEVPVTELNAIDRLQTSHDAWCNAPPKSRDAFHYEKQFLADLARIELLHNLL